MHFTSAFVRSFSWATPNQASNPWIFTMKLLKALIRAKRKLAGRLLRKHSEAFCSGGREGQQGVPVE